jgi:hypothetical protein
MDRTYDIFEVMPDGSVIWRCAVTGHDKAIVRLKELSSETSNEVRLMHVPTKSLIAEMNVPKSQT